MNRNMTQETVLNLLSAALFHKPLSFEKDTDWQAVLAECRAQSVVSLAFAALQNGQVPDKVYHQWMNLVNLDIAANSCISYAHTALHELLTEQKIAYVILKGCISAQYYDNAVLRTMGDIDFYIDPKNESKVDVLLQRHGYIKQKKNHEFETVYNKNGGIYELHTKINGIPGGKIGRKIESYFSDIFAKAEIKTNAFAKYCSPSPFHHGLIMLLHVARHMLTGGIGLRHFCDWAVFIEKIGVDFPKMFKMKLKEIGLWHFAQILSQFCVQYLGASYRAWMGRMEKKLLTELMDDVFAGGNFGHKDLKRADEAKFITSRKKGGVNEGSRLQQTLLAANEIVRKHWRFAEKVPLVYPVGWMFFGSRYVLRAATGKRERIHVSELAQGAEKRKEIYKQLELYQVN